MPIPVGLRRASLLSVTVAVTVALAVTSACGATSSDTHGTVATPTITVGDVHRFLAAAHAMPPGDTACLALDGYLRDESAGLDAYRRKFDVGRRELCSAMRWSPTHY